MSKIRRAVTLFKQMTDDEQDEFFEEAAEIVGGDLLTLTLFDALTPEERGDVVDAIDETYCCKCFEELPEGDTSKHSCAVGSSESEAIEVGGAEPSGDLPVEQDEEAAGHERETTDGNPGECEGDDDDDDDED